jgi:hypothetical protein
VSAHEHIRLETTSGDVIAYFAPAFEVTPQATNDILNAPRQGDRAPIARDNGLWQGELTVQGSFEHSDNVSSTFRNALQTLFGQQTVTPQDQVNRLQAFTVYNAPAAKVFYHNNIEYSATTDADVDVQNGVYPAVSVVELRVPEDGAVSGTRIDYLVRMSVGVESG